ncbi:MAG: phosphotransferase [Tepidiformaceae bacterium]
MAAPATIPYCAAEITPEWLTAVLREGGHIADARVTGIERTTIGEGVGFLGELTRLELTYEGEAAGAPRSLVSKIPTAFAQARAIGNMFRFYEREGRFYEDLAPGLALRVPRCYLSVTDVPGDRYILLLEDVCEATVGDQIQGATLEQARTVLRAAAAFHAAFWESPRLQELSWLPDLLDPIYDPLQGLYQGSWAAFLELNPGLPPEIRPIGVRFGEAMEEIRAGGIEPPMSIAHTDFRLDNMLFGRPGSAPLTVIDWQLMVRANPLIDVGYFLSQSLPIALRRKHERDLVREYHEGLCAGGVAGYDFAQCWQDYRRGVMFTFVIPVSGSANVDLSNPRAVPLLRTLSERSTAAILDLAAADTLPG